MPTRYSVSEATHVPACGYHSIVSLPLKHFLNEALSILYQLVCIHLEHVSDRSTNACHSHMCIIVCMFVCIFFSLMLEELPPHTPQQLSQCWQGGEASPGDTAEINYCSEEYELLV